MSIKTYGGTWGLFSVICDTAIYNAVTDAASAREYVAGMSGLFVTFYANSEALVNNSLRDNIFENYPNAQIKGETFYISQTSYTAEPVFYALNDDKAIRTTGWCYRGSADLRWSAQPYLTASQTTINAPNILGFLGVTGTGGSTCNKAELGILLTNDTMTAWKRVTLYFTTTNITYGLSTPQDQIGLTLFFTNLKPHQDVDPDDPYSGGGDSEEGGGDGTFDYDSIITGGFDDFQLPDNSAVDTGFLTLYNPSAAELKSLSNYLWSNSFDLDTFKKLVNDPMDLILGLSILPIQVPQGERREIGIGLIGTDIYMTTIPTQWVKVDCGSVTIPNYTGSYLDYDPYTSVEIYLPFIGTRTLKADEVMGRTISVGYAIDILSGACVAWVDVDGSLMYTYMGQCATSIPVVSGDWTNVINGILSVVGSAAGGAIKGGVGGAIAGGVAAASSVAVNDSKISVERSGNISGAGGLLAYKRPFIIINAPRICKPANQNIYTGYPSYITQQIGDISGYTEIEVLRLYNIPATDPEIDEIKSLLMGGVIL